MANLTNKPNREYRRQWQRFLASRGVEEGAHQPDERRRLEAQFRLFDGSGFEIVSRAAPPGMTADDDDDDEDADEEGADDDDDGDADDDQVRRLDQPPDDDSAFESWLSETGTDPDNLTDEQRTGLRVFFQQRATPPGV